MSEREAFCVYSLVETIENITFNLRRARDVHAE